LPRPLTVVLAFARFLQRGLATTSRASPRGTKRSPGWYKGRLLQSLALHRNDESGVTARNEAVSRSGIQADCHAPFPWFQASCSSGSGGSQRRIVRHREARSDLPAGIGGDCFSRWRSTLRTQAVAMTSRASPRGTKRSPGWYKGRLLQSLALHRNDESGVTARHEAVSRLVQGEIASVAGAPSQ